MLFAQSTSMWTVRLGAGTLAAVSPVVNVVVGAWLLLTVIGAVCASIAVGSPLGIGVGAILALVFAWQFLLPSSER